VDRRLTLGRRGRKNRRLHPDLQGRYGSWALVAGASEGLGASWALALARRRMNLVLVARRRALLDTLADELRRACDIEVRCCDGDLAVPGFLEALQTECSDIDLGLIVYNATDAPVGEFASTPADGLTRVVEVNVRAPMMMLRAFAPGMVSRGRGGVVLMTSLAGNQGAPRIAAYAASKAFNRVLAEGLWYELGGRGVDVVACCAGAVRTPGYSQAVGKDAPGTLDPDEVVEQALRALGRRPVVIPGFFNRAASLVMGRLLPKRTAIAIMANSTRDLASAEGTGG
jgi:short-subunit dehydrogenase